jgi:hypothetical protein
MSFGGGYKPPPDNSVQLQREQFAREDTNRAAERQRQEEDAARRRGEFTTARDTAIGDYRDRSAQRLTERGLDPTQYNFLIENAIRSGRNALPDLDTNPSQYFTDALLDNAINRTQADRRASYTTQANRAFADNFERGLFQDTADDQFINAILGNQRGEAVRSLDMARSRGSLDQVGYDAAMARLGEMEQAGRSTANNLGSAVIQGYRNRTRDIGNRAREAAGNYELGGDFNLGGYTTELSDLTGTLRNSLEGDISSALAGQQFFDLGDILTRGGSAQGPTNPASLPGFIAERERVRNAERGVGGGGTF